VSLVALTLLCALCALCARLVGSDRGPGAFVEASVWGGAIYGLGYFTGSEAFNVWFLVASCVAVWLGEMPGLGNVVGACIHHKEMNPDHAKWWQFNDRLKNDKWLAACLRGLIYGAPIGVLNPAAFMALTIAFPLSLWLASTKFISDDKEWVLSKYTPHWFISTKKPRWDKSEVIKGLLSGILMVIFSYL